MPGKRRAGLPPRAPRNGLVVLACGLAQSPEGNRDNPDRGEAK